MTLFCNPNWSTKFLYILWHLEKLKISKHGILGGDQFQKNHPVYKSVIKSCPRHSLLFPKSWLTGLCDCIYIYPERVATGHDWATLADKHWLLGLRQEQPVDIGPQEGDYSARVILIFMKFWFSPLNMLYHLDSWSICNSAHKNTFFFFNFRPFFGCRQFLGRT